MITLRQLEALRAVMKYRTLTEAAQMMALSQPALSQLIANLELETSLKLFERQRRRLIPTEEARLLTQYAEEVFSGLRRVEQISDEIRQRQYGRLNISSVMALGREFLPKVLAAFLLNRPKVEIQIGIETINTINDLVAGQRCDIGFNFAQSDQPEIRVIKQYRFPLVCVFPLDDALNAVARVEATNLVGRRFVSLNEGGQQREKIDRHFREVGVKRLMGVDTPQSEVACALVANGAGVSIVNPFAAREYARRGLLLARPFVAPLDVGFSLQVPQGRPVSLVAQEFLDLSIAGLDEFSQALNSDSINW